MRLRDVAAVDPPTPGFSSDDAGAEVSFLPLDRVWHDARFDPSTTVDFDGDTRSYTPVLEGDVLVPKVAPTFGRGRVALARGLVAGRALATSEVFVVRTADQTAARFLQYRFQAADFITEGVASWTGVAGLKRISSDFLRDARIDRDAWRDRDTIARFLDAETACIDDALLRAESLRTLIDERSASVRERLLLANAVVIVIPLRRVARVQTGLTLNMGKNSEAVRERPYLRVANVQPGALVLDTVKRVTVSDEQIHRHSLRYGDVLMTEGGDRDKLGRGVVWRNEVPGALHQNHVFAVRPDISKLLPEYLEMVLAGSHARRYFESTANQTTNLASTNTGIVGALDLPTPPLREQRRIVEEFGEAERRHQALTTAATRQIALLRERRQAVITAAVAGTLQFPGTTTASATA